jgi:hypothetical protein
VEEGKCALTMQLAWPGGQPFLNHRYTKRAQIGYDEWLYWPQAIEFQTPFFPRIGLARELPGGSPE